MFCCSDKVLAKSKKITERLKEIQIFQSSKGELQVLHIRICEQNHSIYTFNYSSGVFLSESHTKTNISSE